MKFPSFSSNPRPYIALFLLVCAAFGYILLDSIKLSMPPKPSEDTTYTLSDDQTTIDNDSLTKIATEIRRDRLEAALTTYLKAATDFTPKAYTTPETITLQLKEFDTWADCLHETARFQDSDLKTLAKRLETRLKRVRSQHLPKMRQSFAFLKEKELWQIQMSIRTDGPNNNIITLSHPGFIKRANAENFHTTILPILTQLRFKEIRYKWFEGSEEYIAKHLASVEDERL